MELSFGEQIKIILKRKNMTIQDLAELYTAQTGLKMTRQNLSQRLRRDNFQEQDMHAIAAMLGFQVSIQLTPISAPEISQISSSIPAQSTVSAISQPPAFSKASAAQKVTTADGSTIQIPKLLKKEPVIGEINPLTGQEYLTNTVRRHPEMENYLQVYDRSTHEWIDVNEDYFWEFQTSKKQILGADYQEPILI
ncbi:MAG: hypothetical protein U0M69_00385 [Lachnospiraceae bacterium]|nr:hypothetical protein [Lachnospiraceae bacterium]